MATRGSLRSETRAAQAALRGEEPSAVYVLHSGGADEGTGTPPPSPQSAARLAVFAIGAEEEEAEWTEEARSSAKKRKTVECMAASDSGSDFFMGEKATLKSKKRRLRQGDTTRTRTETEEAVAERREEEEETEETEETEESVEDQEEEIVETHRYRSNKRDRAQQNWVDDGCVATFETRLRELERSLSESVRAYQVTFYNSPRPRGGLAEEEEEKKQDEGDDDDEIDVGGFNDENGGAAVLPVEVAEEEEDGTPTVYSPDDLMVTDSGLSVPTYMYAHLYPHQKECLEWLHHLHERNTGGILGDEMGLGKTVQIASFLGAMHGAKRVRTVLLLCPASVLLQWVREFHKWYPWLRVVLLHASGTGVTRAGQTYAQLIEQVMQFSTLEEDDEADYTSGRGRRLGVRDGGIVISTYENVRQYQELFIDLEWDYVVLDEGHRIRNPDAEITLVCKQLKTVHRIILTGTPIQNRLRELWSLFDFVYPGKLGTLPTFEDEFVLPIRTGGYANASKMQVVMAYKCALALKDVINPFMLRRTKKEIQHVTKMPEKMEQIIFCSMTTGQYEAYEMFLSSPEVAAVLRQDIRPFRAISILRHICNHPDLLSTMGEYNHRGGGDRATDMQQLARRPPGVPYGSVDGSGKMMVLQKILALWKKQGHRVLVFTQTRKMLDILESYMSSMGYAHCRLDGNTSVKERQSLLDAFNSEGSKIFVFLLTTRAGGIGVNLTGANRVVIFDPDWNPSTDLQARERSWRLGQTKQVTIYRLITSGTIEEKIYHRQIFKQYLTNKVLHDAKRKRCFNKHTLRDLFILGDQNAASNGGSVETTDLFLEGNVENPGNARETEDGEIEEREEDEKSVESAEDGSQEMDGKDTNSGDGDNNEILKQLFSGDQIMGVFNHDVVESDGVQNQEADLIELESSKIAESALGALRASCALVRQQRESLFTPTWTGRSGAAGDPHQRSAGRGGRGGGGNGTPNRFGNRVARGREGSGGVVNLVGRGRGGNKGGASIARVSTNPFAQTATSSRDLLSNLKKRKNGIATSSALSTSRGSSGGGRGVKIATAALAPHLGSNGFMKVDEMAKQLHAFLLLRCNNLRAQPGVTTEELLDGFGAVVAPKDKLVFRNLLRDMAVCRGRQWVLKDEFLTGP